ncbi:MAG: histidine kinase [Rhodobacteraceae bacterium]|nr:histidine kinase [Paracoccaceae bacterium]
MSIAFDHRPGPGPMSAFSREVKILGLSFALVLFVIASIVWGLAGIDPVETAIPKLVGILGDALLAVTITLVLWRIRHLSLGLKALAAIAMSLAAAPVSALIDWGFHAVCVYPEPVPFNPEYFAQVVVFTTSELFGWSCLYLALQYSAQVRASERHLAAVRQQATEAQLRALQYQVNPHFLFNTLNTISGLIEEGENRSANEMVLGLAGFLRKTLALDPLSDLPLGAEIALQRDYLRIEETRFSDRLSVRIDVAPAAQRALVPALLLQPLIENAIRHGVARTPGRAELEIGARIEPGETLAIWVENPVPEAGGATATGLGIGLRNVGERLSARHPGHATSCAFGPAGPGRVRVELRMPFRT